MNENMFASFITPMMMGLPIVILITMLLSMLFPSTNRLMTV